MAQDDYWSQNLIPAKIGGIDIDIADRRVESGRQFARYRYPYRNGQGVEDVGRKIYVWTLKIPLFRGVGLGFYPGTVDAIIKLVDSDTTRGEVEYIDPEWGPFQVKIADWTWETTPEQRNGGVLTLVIEERSFDQSIEDNLNKPGLAKRALASKMAIRIDYELDVAGAPLPDITDKSKGLSLTELWQDVQGAIDSAALAADDVAARIDEIYLVGQDVYNFSAEDEIERFSLYNSVADFLGAAEEVGEDSGDKPPGETLVTKIIPDTMSMYAIAQWLYKDPVRAEEIVFNNPSPNPMAYPRGSRIKVFAA
jgi:prophage DNA circulation protein